MKRYTRVYILLVLMLVMVTAAESIFNKHDRVSADTPSIVTSVAVGEDPLYIYQHDSCGGGPSTDGTGAADGCSDGGTGW